MVDLKFVKKKNLWYVVGLIATDGNLSIDNRHINITSKDESLLKGVKKILNLSSKLTRKSRASEQVKKYFVLQFSDVNLYRYLLSIGLCQKKSLTLGKIDVPGDFFDDFLRGVIDGDGNISTWIHQSNRHTQWALRIFSAAPIFINWIKDFTEKRYHVRGKLYCYKQKQKENPIYTIKFGKLAAKVILSSIYYRGCFSLQRKNLIAVKCLRDKNKMVKYGNVISLGDGIGRHPTLKMS